METHIVLRGGEQLTGFTCVRALFLRLTEKGHVLFDRMTTLKRKVKWKGTVSALLVHLKMSVTHVSVS